MRKRLLLSAVALVAIACAVLLVLAMLPAQPAVTKASFDQIKDGMTTPQAKNLLGPPTDIIRNWSELAPGHVQIAWRGDDGDAIIVFDENDQFVHKNWIDHQVTFFQRVRRWLGLP